MTDCKHESTQEFSLKSSAKRHFYCPVCGWHDFDGKEYTRQEWADNFINEYIPDPQGQLF